MVLLHNSMALYERNIDSILREVLKQSAEQNAQSVMNSSRIQSETYFALQEQLIDKAATLYLELLGEKERSAGGQSPHVLDWETQPRVRAYQEANDLWVAGLA